MGTPTNPVFPVMEKFYWPHTTPRTNILHLKSCVSVAHGYTKRFKLYKIPSERTSVFNIAAKIEQLT